MISITSMLLFLIFWFSPAIGQNVNRTADFPPDEYLGCTLDLMDPHLQLGNIENKFVTLDPRTTPHQVSGNTFNIPNNFGVIEEDSGTSKSIFYSSSSSLSVKIETVVEASMDFFGIFSNDNSIDESVEKQFKTSSQYYLFYYKQEKFQATLRNWEPWIDEQALTGYLKHLPRWDQTNRDVVKIFMEAFQDEETHMILGSINGARFFLKVSASTSNDEINANFQLDVNAEFSYVGSADVDFTRKTTDQYKHYEASRTKEASCVGGNPTAAGRIVGQPDSNHTFNTWADSISEKDSAAIGFELLPIWVILKKSAVIPTARRGREIQDAFTYIAGLKEYRTHCILTVYFKPGSDDQSVTFTIPYFPSGSPNIGLLLDPSYKSNSRVSILGRNGPTIFVAGPYSDVVNSRTVNVPFTIVNDGSAVKFSIETKYVEGCDITIAGKTYPYPNNPDKDTPWPQREALVNTKVYIPNKGDLPDPRLQ